MFYKNNIDPYRCCAVHLSLPTMDNVGYRHLVLHRVCSWFVLGLYICKASYKLFMVQEYSSTHTQLAMQLHTCTLCILLSVAVSDNINTRRDNRHTHTLHTQSYIDVPSVYASQYCGTSLILTPLQLTIY